MQLEGWRTKKPKPLDTTTLIAPLRTPSSARFKRKPLPPPCSYVKVCVPILEVGSEPFARPSTPMCMLSRRRAGQRWSALVSAPASRVSMLIRPVLGDDLWFDFLGHATEYYKPAFLDAFDPPSRVLRCVGQCDGSACPHDFHVLLSSPCTAAKLEHLHLDHEQDVQITCDMWKCALAEARPAKWDDGIDAGLLCHLLFGVRDDPTYGPAMVRFRCGPSGLGSSRGYCHKLNMPHYRNLRDVRLAPQ